MCMLQHTSLIADDSSQTLRDGLAFVHNEIFAVHSLSWNGINLVCPMFWNQENCN